MNEETKRTKKIMMLTVFGVLFLVLMLTALITNLVKMASLNSRKEALVEQLTEINQTIEDNQAAIDYRKTDEYVDAYAREYLGMIGRDELAFIAR